MSRKLASRIETITLNKAQNPMRVHKMDDGFRYEVESILYAQLLSYDYSLNF